MTESSGAGRYTPLRDYLSARTDDGVTLSFAAIEEILRDRLPASAWGRQWWANDAGTAQGRAWLQAGWQVAVVSVSGGREAVRFVRRRQEPSE